MGAEVEARPADHLHWKPTATEAAGLADLLPQASRHCVLMTPNFSTAFRSVVVYGEGQSRHLNSPLASQSGFANPRFP